MSNSGDKLLAMKFKPGTLRSTKLYTGGQQSVEQLRGPLLIAVNFCSIARLFSKGELA